MKFTKRLDRREIDALLHSLCTEPPGPAIAQVAQQAEWWDVQLENPKELGALRTLWKKERPAGITNPEEATEPTVAEVAAHIHNRTFKRPGLQAKVTRYVNKIRKEQMEIQSVLEHRPWGTFIQEGTTRAAALYLLHLDNQNLSRFFPLPATLFKLHSS